MTQAATAAPAPRRRRILRSIGAVLAGLLANIVIAGTIDATLYATGIYPPRPQPMADHLWALALAYRLVFAAVGGFIAARLALSRPMWHAMVLGIIATALSAPFVLINWNRPEFGPHWFALSVAATALPCAMLGGVLARRSTLPQP